MNIFVLDNSPKSAAEYHCDKHVVKMILETAQLLSTAHHVTGSGSDSLYKPTHKNHPCALWVRESRQNYLWALELGQHLLEEYGKRYGRVHKTGGVMKLLEAVPELPSWGLTPFAQAMPEAYRKEDAVEAYRTYYIAEKAPICKWKIQTPWWFKMD